MIRSMLSESLQAVISQTLLKKLVVDVLLHMKLWWVRLRLEI